MRPILILLAAIIFHTDTRAQAPDWVWARGGGGAEACLANTNDKYGNVIFCGRGYPAPDFGNISLPYYGYFVAKADANGTVLYADGPTALRPYYDWMAATAICTDTFGNTYVMGYFGDTVNIGTDTLTGQLGSGSAFIIKYDHDLDILWTQKISGINPQSGAGANAIEVSPGGDVYVAGGFDGSIALGSDILNNPAISSNGYIAKLSAETGDFIWARAIGSTSHAYVRNITSDGSSNIYVEGEFVSHVTLGNIILTEGDTTVPSEYVAKLDPDGNFIWGKKVPGATSIKANATGDIFISGYNLTSSLSIDNFTLNTSASPGYTARLNTNGDCQWLQHTGMTGVAVPLHIALDALGNPYTSGYFYGLVQLNGDTLNNYGDDYIFVAKYFPDGSIIWAKTGGDGSSPEKMSLDPAGNIYISGYYWNYTEFGSSQVAENGQSGYVAKLSSTLSVPQPAAGDLVRVYPNPTPGILHIDVPAEIIESRIIDITGKVVLFARSEKQIDLSALSPGMYYLQVTTTKGTYREKVTVVR